MRLRKRASAGLHIGWHASGSIDAGGKSLHDLLQPLLERWYPSGSVKAVCVDEEHRHRPSMDNGQRIEQSFETML